MLTRSSGDLFGGDPTPRDGEAEGLGPRANLELAVDAVQVALDGAFGEVEDFRYPGVALAGGGEDEPLEFPVCELALGPAADPLQGLAREGEEHLALFAAGDGADGGDEFPQGGGLRQVGAGPELQQLAHQARLGEDGDDHEPRR